MRIMLKDKTRSLKTEKFKKTESFRQGCGLSLTLFKIYLEKSLNN